MRTNLRVLLINFEWPPDVGGGGSHTLYLAEALARERVSVYVVTRKRPLSEEPISRPPGVRVLEVDFEPCSDLLGTSNVAWRQLIELVVPLNIQVIHGQHVPGYVLGSLLRVGLWHAGKGEIPLVISPHKTPPPRLVRPDFVADGTNNRIAKLCVAKTPTAVVATSKTFSRYLRQAGVGRSRLWLIEHGVPDLSRRKGGARPLPYPYVICPARLDHRKRLPEAVTAWRWVAAREGIHLVITGPAKSVAEVQLREKLFRAAKDFRTILHFKTVPPSEMPGLLAGARVCLFPSRNEGFGLSALEALSVGTPVVAGDSDGVREFLRHDLNALIAFEADSDRFKRELAGLLDRILEGGREIDDLRREGRKTAKEFSAEVMARKHVKMYRSLMRRRRSR
jgi:glycogen synthase